jgi:hypothetical protein
MMPFPCLPKQQRRATGLNEIKEISQQIRTKYPKIPKKNETLNPKVRVMESP